MVVVLIERIGGIGKRRLFAESIEGEEEGGETAVVDVPQGDLSGFDGDELRGVEKRFKNCIFFFHEHFRRNVDDVRTVSNVAKRFRFEKKTPTSDFYAVRRIVEGDLGETVAVNERITHNFSYSLRERYAF